MDPEEVETLIAELENRLERLRSLYEQYFLGIEKIEPAVARKDVDRRIWRLRREQIRNTARRFRLQVVIQRYNTFQQYWQRVCREIENGTYKRHLLRAERTVGGQSQATPTARPARRRASNASAESEQHNEKPGVPPEVPAPAAIAPAAPRRKGQAAEPASDFGKLELDLDFPGRKSAPAQPSTPRNPSPAVRAQPPPVPPRPPRPSVGLSDERVRELHAQLLDAKRQLNDPRSITVDGLKQRLAAAETKLRRQHGNRRIDFDVVIRDGKAIVKPILR